MRISGITIPDNKRIEIALTYIFGIGRSKSQAILKEAKVDFSKPAKDLSQDEEKEIRRVMEVISIEGDLKRDISGNVKRLKDIKCYRGARHARRLPVNGQRTKTNSRTVRGNVRKTMGSGKKSVDKK